MSKWIGERSWTIAVYISYILGFVVLSVAGYNYTTHNENCQYGNGGKYFSKPIKKLLHTSNPL